MKLHASSKLRVSDAKIIEKCYNFSDGARMDGTPVAMELHRRERGGGIGLQ